MSCLYIYSLSIIVLHGCIIQSCDVVLCRKVNGYPRTTVILYAALFIGGIPFACGDDQENT